MPSFAVGAPPQTCGTALASTWCKWSSLFNAGVEGARSFAYSRHLMALQACMCNLCATGEVAAATFHNTQACVLTSRAVARCWSHIPLCRPRLPALALQTGRQHDSANPLPGQRSDSAPPRAATPWWPLKHSGLLVQRQAAALAAQIAPLHPYCALASTHVSPFVPAVQLPYPIVRQQHRVSSGTASALAVVPWSH